MSLKQNDAVLWNIRCDFGLGNFVIMMRKSKVDSPGVDIDWTTKGSTNHRTALNVPARPTLSKDAQVGQYQKNLPFPKGNPKLVRRLCLPSKVQNRMGISFRIHQQGSLERINNIACRTKLYLLPQPGLRSLELPLAPTLDMLFLPLRRTWEYRNKQNRSLRKQNHFR